MQPRPAGLLPGSTSHSAPPPNGFPQAESCSTFPLIRDIFEYVARLAIQRLAQLVNDLHALGFEPMQFRGAQMLGADPGNLG